MLAGVVTLSAVSPTLIQGVFVDLAYVLGMVFPLLILTTAWDRWRLGDRKPFRGREVRWHLGARTFVTNATGDFVAAPIRRATAASQS